MALPTPSDLRGAGDKRGGVERHLRRLQQKQATTEADLQAEIDAVEADVGALETAVSDLEDFNVTQEYVKSRGSGAGTAISTTEGAEHIQDIVIPGHWNTYDLEALWSCDILETGTLTALRSVTFRIRLDTSSGTIIGSSIVHINTAAPNRLGLTINGWNEGMNTTGTRSIVVTGEIGGDSGQASWSSGRIIVTAYRVT